jgi:hypothetical protein
MKTAFLILFLTFLTVPVMAEDRDIQVKPKYYTIDKSKVGTSVNPWVVTQDGKPIYELRPKFWDSKNDNWNDGGSSSNPWIVKPLK